MAERAATRRLVAWTLLGFGGAALLLVGGFTGDWIMFGYGILLESLAIFLLATGLWMSWPRGRTAAMVCHCGRTVEPRDPDPWEGRMDGYCEDCAINRCDCYPDECPVKHPQASSAASTLPEWMSAPVVAFGLVVSPMPRIKNDRLLFAEVVPAGSRWLPWRGRTSRWWFEVHAQHAPDEHGVSGTTYAYTEGGSGGAFTLRGCIAKAMESVDKFVWEDTDDGDE